MWVSHQVSSLERSWEWENTRKNTTENIRFLLWQIFFNDLSYAKLEVGENKTECDLLVRIRSLPAKRRAVSEEARRFFVFQNSAISFISVNGWPKLFAPFSFFLKDPRCWCFFCFVVLVKMWPETEELFLFLLPNIMGKGLFWRRGDTHVEKESFQSCNFPIPPEKFDSGRSDRRLTGGVSLRADGLRSWELVPLLLQKNSGNGRYQNKVEIPPWKESPKGFLR